MGFNIILNLLLVGPPEGLALATAAALIELAMGLWCFAEDRPSGFQLGDYLVL